MLKISVTTLDTFRKFLLEEITDKLLDEYIQTNSIETMSIDQFLESKFIQRLTGEFVPTPAMERGTALHNIIENPSKYYLPGSHCYKSNDTEFEYSLVNNNILPLFNYEYPFEVKTTKLYELSTGEKVEVVGKADQLVGNMTIDIKTTWGGFQYEYYSKSYQWRYYLDLFESELFRYLVFQLYEGKNGIILKEVHDFYFSPYDGMKKDIMNLLENFVAYIHLRKLTNYFKKKD
jgi:hypothetical protein